MRSIVAVAMIPAHVVLAMTEFTAPALARALAHSGYTGQAFETAEFLGITSGGQFCYRVSFYDDGGPEETLETGKVFLSYDSDVGQVTAEY